MSRRDPVVGRADQAGNVPVKMVVARGHLPQTSLDQPNLPNGTIFQN